MDNENKTKIERLLELKKLFEQGILTKEEMEAEKSKILGTDKSTESPSSQSVQSSITNSQATLEDSVEETNTQNKTKIVLGVIVVGVIIILIIIGKNYLSQNELASTIQNESAVEVTYNENLANDGYEVILSERKLTEADLDGKTPKELEILRNMIFARHGYRFRRDDLFQHFSQYSWYNPTTSDASAISDKLTEIEIYNVEFIKKIEDAPLSIDELRRLFDKDYESACQDLGQKHGYNKEELRLGAAFYKNCEIEIQSLASNYIDDWPVVTNKKSDNATCLSIYHDYSNENGISKIEVIGYGKRNLDLWQSQIGHAGFVEAENRDNASEYIKNGTNHKIRLFIPRNEEEIILTIY